MNLTRILILTVLAFLIALAGTTAGMMAGQTPGEPDLTPLPLPVTLEPALVDAGPPPTPGSDWSAAQNGVRMRVKTTKEIEQGMPLEATLEWTVIPDKLPAGVKQLNSFLYPAHVTVTFVHGQTGKKYTVTPFDPTASMPASDNGKTAASLDGSPIKPWPVSFPLVKLGASLEPGQYVCKVQFTFPKEPTGWWQGNQADWAAAGFWHGTVQSGDLMLTILKANPKIKSFVLPKQLRLDKELKVIFAESDAESVNLPLRNGHFVSAKLSRNGMMYSLRDALGLRTYDIDQWRDYKGGPIKVTYTIEIFETADPPVHKWHPGPGSGGYKTLWQKSFVLEFTEQQIKKIQTPAPSPIHGVGMAPVGGAAAPK